METDSIQDSTRYVVSDVHHGSILPGNRAELDVFILNNAEVKGAIWANDLTINGSNVLIEDSVYAKRTVLIKNEDKGKKNG